MGKITRRELSGGLVSELNKTGRLDELTTLDKTNLVKAINEVDAKEVDLTPINNKLEDIEGVGRTTETIKKNADDIILVDTKVSEHLAGKMPHLVKDDDTGKIYRVGRRFKDGGMQKIWEEVV